ncbi:MAG: hypothetical protein ABSC06_13635 [Rhodopila sp.]|jgi:hypothetical protein
MTRAEVLALYRPIRAGVRRVLRIAATACNRADLTRAVKHIAPGTDVKELTRGETPNMVADVALFEPNQRGRRAYDRFLEQKAGQLDAADRALAQSMAGAWFSIFRVAERHEIAGYWLEDLLDGDRRHWLMDESMEASATEGIVIGMRMFDAQPFHAGFGIVVTPDAETTHFATSARASGCPIPFRHSLAATLYGDQLRAGSRLARLIFH